MAEEKYNKATTHTEEERNSPLGTFAGDFVGRKVGWGVAVVGFAVG